MDKNYQQLLRIASDALSLKFSLIHSVLYWQDGHTLEKKAAYSADSCDDKKNRYVLSTSMMGAVLKPLVIGKTIDGERLQQILIPLISEEQKIGILVFWGKQENGPGNDSDKCYLDMIGHIVLKTILALEDGSLSTEDTEADAIRLPSPVEVETEPPEDFFSMDAASEDSDKSAEDDGFILVDLSEESLATEDDVDGVSSEELAPEIEESPVLEETERGIAKEDIDLLLRISSLGLLVFDKECVIKRNHPLYSPDFFQETPEDASALDILFKWGDAVNRDSASFEKDPDYPMIKDLMETVFARITDIDVLKEMLPAEVLIKDDTYKMGYHYLKSSVSVEEDVILAVFRNVSSEKNLEFQYNNEIDRTNMIVKVALDVDGYYQYKNSTEEIFEAITAELDKPPSETSMKAVLHHIQAIQGGAEIYEINEITQLTETILSILEEALQSDRAITEDDIVTVGRRVEFLRDRFQLLQKQYLDNLVSDEQILDKAVYRVTKSKIVDVRDEIIENIIKRRMKELELVFEKNYKPFTLLKSLEEITLKRLDSIKHHIWNHLVEGSIDDIGKAMSVLRRQPIGLMFKRYAIIAVNLGERLKKRVEVEIKGAEVEVPFHTLEHLFTGLTFAIRNSVEHGLETMEERIALDKSLEGNITIAASMAENRLQIILTDDGNGIDVNKIKTAAVSNGVMTEEQAAACSNDEILQLMFTKGFSTKKNSQGTFGRGVGLNAVGGAVEELGGNISIRTEPKKGTTIDIEIPLQQ